jgi:hypothetical protein
MFPSLIPGTIYILPEMDEWFHATKWFPAEFVDFDVTRRGREYEFKWIPGIVWAVGDPEDMTFYRSIAQWVEVDGVGRLREDQVRTFSFHSDPCAIIVLILCSRSAPSTCLNASSLSPKMRRA